MNHITLYEQDRERRVSQLHEVHRGYLDVCLKDNPDIKLPELEQMRVMDLEQYFTVHYVDKNRDLSAVSPIPSQYDRKTFQPLLDALASGDFELAEALTPEKLRLCGYTELTETVRKEEYGIGWAGQFCFTDVPPGVYPIFAEAFRYHERDRHFTNEVATSGLFEWYEGTCIASSSPYFKGAEPNVVTQTPYSYSLSAAVLQGRRGTHLIHPFVAKKSLFRDSDGKCFMTHSIVDSSTPYKADCNPISLRGRSKPQEPQKMSLAEQLLNAESVRADKACGAQNVNRDDRQPSAER